MREIKFRAWLIKEKIMIYTDENKNKDVNFYGIDYLSPNNNGLINEFFIDPLGDYSCPDQSILMQYTGMNDKNGNEIYEGDILFYAEGDKKGIVYFDELLLSYMADYENNKDYLHECDFDKIIGNIYENPQLLESK